VQEEGKNPTKRSVKFEKLPYYPIFVNLFLNYHLNSAAGRRPSSNQYQLAKLQAKYWQPVFSKA